MKNSSCTILAASSLWNCARLLFSQLRRSPGKAALCSPANSRHTQYFLWLNSRIKLVLASPNQCCFANVWRLWSARRGRLLPEKQTYSWHFFKPKTHIISSDIFKWLVRIRRDKKRTHLVNCHRENSSAQKRKPIFSCLSAACCQWERSNISLHPTIEAVIQRVFIK